MYGPTTTMKHGLHTALHMQDDAFRERGRRDDGRMDERRCRRAGALLVRPELRIPRGDGNRLAALLSETVKGIVPYRRTW